MEKAQLSCPPIFRLHCRPARFPLPPPALMQRVAGAKAIPNARRADGAPQQARTSPGRNGREGSRRRPARHAADGVQPNSRDKFRVPAQRGVRGCRGCRGAGYPSHPLPRAGQATCRPCRAAAAMHRGTPAHYGQGVLPFSKVKRSGALWVLQKRGDFLFRGKGARKDARQFAVGKQPEMRG